MEDPLPNFEPPPRSDAPLADAIAALREFHRERQDYHSAEKRMTLQIKSIQRRTHARTCTAKTHAKCAEVYAALPAAALVLQEMKDALEVRRGHACALGVRRRQGPEVEMERLARQLPVWPWWESVKGVGALGLAQIIAECGDLGTYSNPAKVWKRMGLGMYQRTDGQWERQRKAEGDNGVLAGYSPTRRSIMYVIGESIIKAGGPYRELYDKRKVDEAEKPSCGKTLATGGKCEDPERPGHCKPGHVHNRAKRYMEKRLLRDLWRRWRAVARTNSTADLPAPVAEAV